jgi:murein DD-endopeptidase MepM/ murein hydrolase activator NlpD
LIAVGPGQELPGPPAPPPDRSELLDETEAPSRAAQPQEAPGAGLDDIDFSSRPSESEQARVIEALSSPSYPGPLPPGDPGSAADSSSAGFVRTGHPVRDRLLAKATEARAKTEVSERQSDLPGFSTLEAVSSELDEIAAPKGGNSTPFRLGGATISSSNLLLFGTVCGVATVVSLFTLLIQFSPPGEVDLAATPLLPTLPGLSVVAPAATAGQPAASVLPPAPRQKQPGPWRIGQAGTGQKRLSGTIGRDPFLRAIQAAGIPKGQAYRIHTALKGEKNLDRCRPKDEFRALLDSSSNRVVAFEYIVSPEEIYQAREGKDGLLQGKRLDLKVTKQRVQGSMIVTSESFANAARAAHLEPELGAVLNRALDGHTSVSQFQRGDRLRVVAQEVTVLGEFYRYAGLEALEYLPVSGKPLRIFYFDRRKRYYDSRGRAPGEGGWRKPVKGAPITSKFNPKRLHPILKKLMPHNGTDFGAPTGTPVYASSYGKIIKRGDYGPNGNFISIQHENGYDTGYSHLSRFEDGLKVGDNVKRMQVIGYVGSTGRSTGPHLHFSVRKNGQYIDPEALNLDALTVLPPEDRGDFAKVRAQYDELLEGVRLIPKLPETIAAPAGTASAPDLGMDDAMLDPSGETGSAPLPPRAALSPEAAPGALLPSTAPPEVPATPTLTPLPSPGGNPAGPAVQSAAGFGSLYLSDKELMESQSASDEGEVER